MVDQTSPRYAARSRETSGWAIGFIVLAATMMVMSGVFQVIQGLVAIFENEFYVATPAYLFHLDVTAWGWFHLIWGALVGLAGWALLSGQTWARVVGIVLAVGSAITNFAFLPYYPLWAVLVITLDVIVIWALAAHGRDVTA